MTSTRSRRRNSKRSCEYHNLNPFCLCIFAQAKKTANVGVSLRAIHQIEYLVVKYSYLVKILGGV
jgi:hypothetical protein